MSFVEDNATLSSLRYFENHVSFFVAFVEDNATLSSLRYFENHVSFFFVQPNEVDPIKLSFPVTKQCCNSTQIHNQQRGMKKTG